MANSYELIQKRSEYYAFKENVKELANRIKATIDELYSPVSQIAENFTVDGESGDTYKLKKYQEQLIDSYNNLINLTIPSIENRINYLTSEIETALEEENIEEFE